MGDPTRDPNRATTHRAAKCGLRNLEAGPALFLAEIPRASGRPEGGGESEATLKRRQAEPRPVGRQRSRLTNMGRRAFSTHPDFAAGAERLRNLPVSVARPAVAQPGRSEKTPKASGCSGRLLADPSAYSGHSHRSVVGSNPTCGTLAKPM